MNTQKIQSKVQPKLVALFASDIHLHPSLPRTTKLFFDFLKQAAEVSQLYLLGDLFEYWAGDDDMSTPYHQKIVNAIQALTNTGTRVFWMAGNRDFLVGKRFSEATGVKLLEDPSVINVAGKSIVITHGDAQCTDDLSYMAFRAEVRQEQWQKKFISLPLQERKKIIEGLRKDSRMEQGKKEASIMDVNPIAISELFLKNHVQIMIHGHTHRPARHRHIEGLRFVLPDWECDQENEALRGGWLEIFENGEILFHHLNGKTNEFLDY